MRKPLIAANWKMNNTVTEAIKFFAALRIELKATGGIDVVIAPPFTALYSMGVAMADTEYSLGAQNIFWEDCGAYTAEVSGPFLVDVGCRFVIIGHSERRKLFGETDESANLRTKAALRHGLIPIFCVGETLGERESGGTPDVIERQLRAGLRDIDVPDEGDFVIAYEPVWAIGTGKTATPKQAEEAHALIRSTLSTLYDTALADRARIIYGGSVKPSNSREIVSQANIDGALVGGASLNPQHFAAIIRSAHTN